MPLSSKTISLLGRIVDLSQESPIVRADVATQLAIEGSGLPEKVETALNSLLSEPEPSTVDRVRRAVAIERIWEISAPKLVRLVIYLVQRKLLSYKEAAPILASCPLNLRQGLTVEERGVVEVADAVCEDARDGFMEIDEDDVFRKAINRMIDATSA